MTKLEHEELLRVAQEQDVEHQWWGGLGRYETRQEVQKARRKGELVSVSDGPFFKISAHAPVDLRVLRPSARALLLLVGEKWAARMVAAEFSLYFYFLVATSFTRPIEYQNELIVEGKFPAVSPSSHERGMAFDIGVEWFRKNLPFAADALIEVLDELKIAGLLNYVDESMNGVIHVCPSPRFMC